MASLKTLMIFYPGNNIRTTYTCLMKPLSSRSEKENQIDD